MNRRIGQFVLFTCCLLGAGVALGQGTVTLDLVSPQDGGFARPQDTIDWAINATVGIEDNLGLALFTVDLVQSPDNPQETTLGSGDPAPQAMAGFSRPAGFSNMGASAGTSAYGGTPMGPSGTEHLVQIGGGQNTFGIAGTGLGEDIDVDVSIGQSPGGLVVATGDFAAPPEPGSYSYSLENMAANTLTTIGKPPAPSLVDMATIESDHPTITFTVCAAGDADGSLAIEPTADIAAFVTALVDDSATGYQVCACDFNDDGAVDGLDIGPFAAEILSAGP